MTNETNQKMYVHPLMTTKEAAQYLALSKASLETWRSTNRYPLQYVKIGRCVRYRIQDLDKYIEDNLSSPAA